jgi:ankyrin repeat protein
MVNTGKTSGEKSRSTPMTDEPDDLYTHTEFESAIIQGDTETFQQLVDDADLTHRAGSGRTPLHKAATMGRMEFVVELLDRGADPDAQDDGGKTPLHLALDKGHHEIAELLLDHGARADIEDMYGAEPLQEAASSGNDHLTKRLLERGADPTHENEAGITPLEIARRSPEHRPAELLESYADTETE